MDVPIEEEPGPAHEIPRFRGEYRRAVRHNRSERRAGPRPALHLRPAGKHRQPPADGVGGRTHHRPQQGDGGPLREGPGGPDGEQTGIPVRQPHGAGTDHQDLLCPGQGDGFAAPNLPGVGRDHPGAFERHRIPGPERWPGPWSVGLPRADQQLRFQ